MRAIPERFLHRAHQGLLRDDVDHGAERDQHHQQEQHGLGGEAAGNAPQAIVRPRRLLCGPGAEDRSGETPSHALIL
jgi:hypothetical protein